MTATGRRMAMHVERTTQEKGDDTEKRARGGGGGIGGSKEREKFLGFLFLFVSLN
jgi:hypothetical protein